MYHTYIWLSILHRGIKKRNITSKNDYILSLTHMYLYDIEMYLIHIYMCVIYLFIHIYLTYMYIWYIYVWFMYRLCLYRVTIYTCRSYIPFFPYDTLCVFFNYVVSEKRSKPSVKMERQIFPTKDYKVWRTDQKHCNF